MENKLRLILLFIGAVIILGMCIDELLRRKRANKIQNTPVTKQRNEPSIGALNSAQKKLTQELTKSESFNSYEVKVNRMYDKQHKTVFDSNEMPPAAKKGFAKKQFIRKRKNSKMVAKENLDYIALTVVLPKSRLVSTREINLAGRVLDLVATEDCLLTKFAQIGSEKTPLFKVASLTKPGFFDFENTDDSKVPGLLFYFFAIDSKLPVLAFEEMVRCARDFSLRFSASLCNEECELLDIIAFDKLRNAIQNMAQQQETQAVS